MWWGTNSDKQRSGYQPVALEEDGKVGGTPVDQQLAWSKRKHVRIAAFAFVTVMSVLYFGRAVCFDQDCQSKVKLSIRGFHATVAEDPYVEDSPNAAEIEEEILEEQIEEENEAEVEGTELKITGVDVKKRTFWPKARVLFLAGALYGGHEVFHKALDDVCKEEGNECVTLCTLSRYQFWYTFEVDKFNKMRLESEQELERVMRESEQGKIYIVNNFNPSDCHRDIPSTLAYPPREREPKSYSFPNVHELARLAENTHYQVDLRVVYLDQDISKTVREWRSKIPADGKALRSFKILEANMQTLFAQMRQIDRKFYMGYNVDTLESTEDLDTFTGLKGFEEAVKRHQLDFAKAREALPKLSGYDVAYMDELETVNSQLQALIKSDASQVIDVPLKVVKNSINSESDPRPKILFLAGLEGTGHHLWSIVMHVLMNKGVVHPHCELERTLFFHYRRNSLWYNNRFIDSYAKTYDRLVELLKGMKADPSNGGKIFLGNLADFKSDFCNAADSGMLSYPNFSGSLKDIQRPHMYTLAKACEAAGVDLQIVLLLRNVDSVVVSTVDHRGFSKGHPGGYQMKVLNNNINGLYSQLTAISPKFVKGCVDYDDHDLSYLPYLEQVLELPELELIVRKRANLKAPVSKDEETDAGNGGENAYNDGESEEGGEEETQEEEVSATDPSLTEAQLKRAKKATKKKEEIERQVELRRNYIHSLRTTQDMVRQLCPNLE